MQQKTLHGIEVDITFKPIKNLNMRLSPADGRVQISAPLGMRLQTIENFISDKKSWIEKHQTRLKARPVMPPKTYTDGERHQLWGEDYRLNLVPTTGRQHMSLVRDQIYAHIRDGATAAHIEALMEGWYRQNLRQAAMPMMAQWAEHMGVAPRGLYVQRMKSRWGSCNIRRHTIRLNTELVHKPHDMLEYVVVHELVHLFERYHNARFYRLMDKFLPDWKAKRQRLNGRDIERGC